MKTAGIVVYATFAFANSALATVTTLSRKGHQIHQEFISWTPWFSRRLPMKAYLTYWSNKTNRRSWVNIPGWLESSAPL